jgi:hypothetical protein
MEGYATMNDPKSTDLRHRLKELLAIPERLRTEAQWDELNELEISLTSVNREESPEQGMRGNAADAPAQRKPGGGPPGAKKPFRKLHRRPPKPKAP